MTQWLGRVGSCWWSYSTGPVLDEEWTKYVRFIADMGDSDDPRKVFWIASYKGAAPNAKQREQLAAVIRAAQRNTKLPPPRGFAYVFDSAVARGVQTAITWLVRLPYPQQVFANPVAGAEWLAGQTSGFKAEELILEVRRHVPRDHDWLFRVNSAHDAGRARPGQ